MARLVESRRAMLDALNRRLGALYPADSCLIR